MEDHHVERFKVLDEMPENATREMKQSRGTEFEVLINDIVEHEGILLRRSYYTKDNRSEQIDGAIEVFNRVFLIEVKWVESGMAASELYAFIGKCDNKFTGTLGVFISRAALHDNFLNSLNKGRRQSIIVIHGQDIDLLFKEKVSLREYLTFTFKLLSYDNRVHFSMQDYLKITTTPASNVDDSANKVEASDVKDKVVAFMKSNIMSTIISGPDLLLEVEKQTDAEKDLTLSFIVRMYSNVFYKSLLDPKRITIRNFDSYIDIYNPQTFSDSVRWLTNAYYTELLEKALPIYSRSQFVQLFSPFYQKLDRKIQQVFEKFLLKAILEYYDSWDAENQITRVIRPIWEFLSEQTKGELFKVYLDFFISSSRASKFEQKQFAIELLEKEMVPKNIIEYWLIKKLMESKTAYNGTEHGLTEDGIIFIANTYVPLAKYLEIGKDKWIAYIREHLDRNTTT